MPVILVPVGIGLGTLLIGAITFLAGSVLANLLAPVIWLYSYIFEPPEEVQQAFLQPVLEEVINTPYTELTGDEKKFIITVNGIELLVTYYLDDNWFTGYKIGWRYSLHITAGEISNDATDEHDIARKIKVKIEPHNPQTEEADFHSFTKDYAAVPSQTWYNLVPYDDYVAEELPKQREQYKEAEKRWEAEKQQRKQEEDAKIRRAN